MHARGRLLVHYFTIFLILGVVLGGCWGRSDCDMIHNLWDWGGDFRGDLGEVAGADRGWFGSGGFHDGAAAAVSWLEDVGAGWRGVGLVGGWRWWWRYLLCWRANLLLIVIVLLIFW